MVNLAQIIIMNHLVPVQIMLKNLALGQAPVAALTYLKISLLHMLMRSQCPTSPKSLFLSLRIYISSLRHPFLI